MNLRFFNSFYSLIALAIPTQTYSSPFNFFQQRPGDKGNGNCHNTGNLYADALVASHASYHAFRSFEHAARHPNPASFLANPLHLVQIEDAVVCHRGHTHKVLHLAVGDGHDALVLRRAVNPKPQGLQYGMGERSEGRFY